MGATVDRQNGQNYSDNVIDDLLAFDRAQTWTVSSGTGSATIDDEYFFDGNSSLQIQNTAPTTDLVVTNSVQSTIVKQSGNYGMSMYLAKTQALEFMTLEVNVFKNAVLFNTQTFVLGSEDADLDIDAKWQRFDTFIDYALDKDDDITFTFTLKGKAGTALLNTTIWVDGFMLYYKDRNNVMPPSYVPPKSTLLTKLQNEKGWGYYVDSLSTPTIEVGTTFTQITIDKAGATIEDYLPLAIRGTGTLLAGSLITPIALGDDYDGRLDITVTAKSGLPTYIEIIIDISGATAGDNVVFTGYIQTAKTPPYNQSSNLDFYTLSTFLANGGKIFARVDTGTVTVGRRNIKLSRKNSNLG